MTESQAAAPPETRFTVENVESYVNSAASLAGFDLPPEYRAGVTNNLRQILMGTADLMALELDVSDEAAPVFRP